jgi:putative hemolysin
MAEKFIDVQKLIASKNPRLIKFIPGFVIRYLKRVIHEDELNQFLIDHGEKRDFEFLDEVLRFLNADYDIEGLENLSTDQRYIFVSNHPLGGLDGMILLQIIGKKFGFVKVTSNDLLMNLKPLANFFLPVNKHGSQSVQNATLIEQAYGSNLPILNFPAGLCSRKNRGKIADLEWKKSFIVKGIAHKRYIVPIYFKGKNSSFFYNLSKIRTFLGIKLNIEMLYLADEMFRQRGRKQHIKFGTPISYETFDKSRKPIWWANWVKEQVYKMESQFQPK